MLMALMMIVLAGEPADLDEQQVFVRGVVLDPPRDVLFLKAADGRLEARELATGALRWRREEGVDLNPLARVGPWLAAWTAADEPHAMEVFLIDADSGSGEFWRSGPLAFPAWVAVEGLRGQSLSFSPRVIRGELTVAWEARAEYAGGAQPTQEVLDAARKRAHGELRVDPGRSAALEVDEAPRPGGSHRYWDGYAYVEHAFGMNDAKHALAWQSGEDGESLSLSEVAGSDPRPVVTGRGIRTQLTSDRAHLLVEYFDADGQARRQLVAIDTIGKRQYPGSEWPQALGVYGGGLAHIDGSTLTVRPDGGSAWNTEIFVPDVGPRPR